MTEVTASGGTDRTAQRDYYYYVAYARDGYGTRSAASEMTGGTLNYHLGDVTGWYMPPDPDPLGDNCVCTVDISKLGGHYGIALVPGDPYGDLDVGPTTTMYIDGRPHTDNQVDFEEVRRIAGTCVTGCAIAKPGPVTATPGKKHGLILADNGSDWFVSGAHDPRWDDDKLADLRAITGDAFEVVYTGEIETY